jgi:hypothetical protein
MRMSQCSLAMRKCEVFLISIPQTKHARISTALLCVAQAQYAEKEIELQAAKDEASARIQRAKEAKRARFEKTKKALVIGMGYKNSDHDTLKNAVNDAKDMGDLLERESRLYFCDVANVFLQHMLTQRPPALCAQVLVSMSPFSPMKSNARVTKTCSTW